MSDLRPGLEGKVALVTGAGLGIGRAIAELLAARGARLVVNDLGTPLERIDSDPSVAAAAAQSINEAGGVAIANHDSVASRQGAERMIEAALGAYGRLDILVNNAGITRPAAFQQMTEDQWDEVIAVHLRGTFLCAQAASKAMVQGSYGRIINMSSHRALGVGSRGGARDYANYSAAKAGILGLTRALARELAPLGITCNAVMPSAETRSTLASRERQRQAGQVVGLRSEEEGKPADIAPLIAFLAGSEASGVTGRTFFAKGGRIELYSDPMPVRGLFKVGRWTVEELATAIPLILS